MFSTRSGLDDAAPAIGFSLGAQLAIRLASGHPELVSQVIVVSAQAKAMPSTNVTLRALGVAAPLARRTSRHHAVARLSLVARRARRHTPTGVYPGPSWTVPTEARGAKPRAHTSPPRRLG
jgi:pimeloyl-ACP methyl ester carboxylesterase